MGIQSMFGWFMGVMDAAEIRRSKMVKISTCSCESAYQDQEYGKGRRVKNERVKDGKHKGWTCTVCGQRDEQ